MAGTFLGNTTLNDLDIFEIASDPTVSPGLTAPVGTLALAMDGSGGWIKVGAGDQAWVQTTNPFSQLQYTGLNALPSTTATTASGTLTLTTTSASVQILTGTAASYTVVMASALTLAVGEKIEVFNTSSQPVTIQDGSGATLVTLGQNSVAYLTLVAAGSAAGTWVVWTVFYGSPSGLLTYLVTSATTFSTSSTTDTVITGMTVTPVAGTYKVLYYANTGQGNAGATHTYTIYSGGTAVANSLGQGQGAPTTGANQIIRDATGTITTVNGTQAIDVRIKSSAGSVTIGTRTLLLERTGS